MNTSFDILKNNKANIELGKLLLERRIITPEFTKVYFNTNEHIDKTLEHFDIKGKKVLTVMGSGEQVFYSLLHGAETIDAFDINMLTGYIYALKEAAIISLTREEYLKFFPIIRTEKEHFFSRKSYLKLRDNLNIEERKFWDTMFKKKFAKYYGRFSCYSPAQRDLEKPYYSEENYPILQQKLESGRVTFYQKNLLKLPNKIKYQKNSYSGILLSNIHDWLPIRGEDFNTFIKEEITPLLTDDGTCLARYMFFPNKNYPYEDFETKTIYENNKGVGSIVLIKK